jgi:hypothetical protein
MAAPTTVDTYGRALVDNAPYMHVNFKAIKVKRGPPVDPVHQPRQLFL